MTRPKFIANYKDHIEEDNSHYRGSDEKLSIGCAIGKILGLEKIGIHIETLLPGRRTSWPHAESAEEEFAFIIEGHPEVWIDGVTHKLNPGDFVAFPSGTGIAHTFLNNTETNCVLLVGGEKSKPENKIFYPMHPKRNAEMKEQNRLWENKPEHILGPHDGKPDLLRKLENS